MQFLYLNRTKLSGKRHAAVFGPFKLAFVELNFAVDQAGAGMGETYTTASPTGMAIPDSALAYVGLKRLQQVVQLQPGTFAESIGGTSQLINAQWSNDTQRLTLYRTSSSNAELANGNNLANTKLRLLLIGV